MLPPAGPRIAELIPTSLPSKVTNAPPELPGIDRGVRLDKILITFTAEDRFGLSALTMPDVTVCPRPNGLPIATT